MSEASNYTGSSEPAPQPSSPATRPSRPSKKVHNFGKRSNSIRRNTNAPVIKSNWLYKQDSTGMKLWKKRWFVLSDMCLFYYRDEKEEGILGSILLPSFHISMLSLEDHINRKYAFKATHPNMRTYYFCSDTAKDMESWMKVMTDAALVHAEPNKRLDRLKVEQCGPQEVNHVANHRPPPLTRPEILNNERNRPGATDPELSNATAAEEERRKREAERYGFQKEGGQPQQPLTKISSLRLLPALASSPAASTASLSGTPRTAAAETDRPSYRSPQLNGAGDDCPAGDPSGTGGPLPERSPGQEPDRTLQRTNSMQQLEQWVRTQRVRNQDDDTRSVLSYQTLPRNMPSHRPPPAMPPHYADEGLGYRTMPRNSLAQRDSICSLSPSLYEQALGMDKRRSMRDDTLWQLYEWQQRQAYVRPAPGPYGGLPSPKTMINLSEHAGLGHSIPASPSHGSLSMYGGYSPLRSYNMAGSARSELGSPVYRGDMSLDRRHRPHLTKYAYPPDRRSMPVGMPVQTITAQSLHGKTASPEDYREQQVYLCRPEVDIDAKLSRLCEQDKAVRTQEDKLQQLHREKHMLETALLSASQELELGHQDGGAVHSIMQQRDLLQSGLLGTCRELSRVSAELEHLWREYDKLEADVTLAKSQLLEQLEALGSPQTEPPSQQHVHIQKELWRIQDVQEALSKNQAQRNQQDGARPISSKHKNEGPDYRLYKSEPELTTVAEVDESNGEERSEHAGDSRGMAYPVGIVPPRTKSPMAESSSIASYVTLRKGRKPEPRGERPRSAVDQLCSTPTAEGSRGRMSVEEQLERIRRHQQGALREKKKGLTLVGGGGGGSRDSTPSRSPSFPADKPPRAAQAQGSSSSCSRRREEGMGTDILELEASMREQQGVREHETPAEEIARLKEASLSSSHHYNMDRELSVPDKVVIPERYVESDPEEPLSPQQEADKQKKVDRIKALIAKNSMQSVVPSLAQSPEEEAEEEATAQEQEKMINISYELAAEASKRSKLVAAQARASVKTYT